MVELIWLVLAVALVSTLGLFICMTLVSAVGALLALRIYRRMRR